MHYLILFLSEKNICPGKCVVQIFQTTDWVNSLFCRNETKHETWQRSSSRPSNKRSCFHEPFQLIISEECQKPPHTQLWTHITMLLCGKLNLVKRACCIIVTMLKVTANQRSPKYLMDSKWWRVDLKRSMSSRIDY